jgi:type I restriction enzyme, R subunit
MLKHMMSNILNTDFDEARQSQLPFVELLINMGYTYLSREQIMMQRKEDTTKFLLKDIAFEKLSEINSYEHKGKEYKFSDKDVREVIDSLENIPFEGLLDTSRKIFNLIMPTNGGKSVKVFHDGKSESKDFRFIDFANPENNAFHVCVEYVADGKQTIRPDIVVFVNGVPFAIIENKKSSIEVKESINQHLRNQQVDRCPRLFAFPQLLVAANKSNFLYGTTATPRKFYARWKEKDLTKEEREKEVGRLIEKKISTQVYQQLCKDLSISSVSHNQIIDRLVSEQDMGVVALFKKDRLLDLCKNFVVYDAGIKKIARYQQYFAVKKIFDRINCNEDAKRREGGLVWHTQGSGKSLTMVMFVKALIDHPEIHNPRVIIVTDRRDLDKQIKKTFNDCGLKKAVKQATSGENLLKLIKGKDLSVITTLVQKFDAASYKRAGFVDEDKDIFILVDEAHRTHGGEANLEMNRILPNACYIAFTGTPLMKEGKESIRKFGSYIDQYTIDEAVKDRAVLPLIYEGRYVELEQNSEQLDRRVERVVADLDEKSSHKLHKEMNQNIIQDNRQRIEEIGFDIENHFLENFKGTGLKAQVVAPSKYSAVLFHRYFKKQGKVRSSVIISKETGIVDDDNAHKKEVVEYLKEISRKFSSTDGYEKEQIDSFKHNDEGVELLIVVDKLLTGFDAPRNTVLYLTKQLRDHNLLQAIARVNRLYENKIKPKTSGYIIDYSENARNLDRAMKLFGNFADEDIKGALYDYQAKKEELEKAHGDLNDIFKTLPADDESFIRFLDDEAERKLFYEAFNSFVRIFSECMSLKEFATEYPHIDTYKKTLKRYANLRSTVRTKHADTVDLSEYKRALIELLDKYVDAKGIELLTAPVDITDPERFKQAVEELGTDKSKAEAIAAYMDRTISEKKEQDPEFYQRFSERIQEIIQKMKDNKIADAEALGQMQLIKEEVTQKKDDTSPEKIKEVKGADIFYRNLRGVFTDKELDEDQYSQIILDLIGVLRIEAIVDWHKNTEVKRIIACRLDDYLYDVVKLGMNIDLSSDEIKDIAEKTVHLAQNNKEIFSV